MKRFAALGLILFLSACAMPGSRQDEPADMATYRTRLADLSALNGFHVQARAAVATADDGWSGQMLWQQQAETVDFLFKGPLGSGTVRITGQLDHLLVETSRGESFETTDPATDFREWLGWALPLSSMRHWILGIPDAGRPIQARVVDAAGRLRSLSQGRWEVEYQDYQAVGERQLPRKLVIRNPEVRIRVVVGEWQQLGAGG